MILVLYDVLLRYFPPGNAGISRWNWSNPTGKIDQNLKKYSNSSVVFLIMLTKNSASNQHVIYLCFSLTMNLPPCVVIAKI